MKTLNRKQAAQSANSAPQDWRHSQTLFLLKCYDIWSATPPRGCDCRDTAPAVTAS